MDLGVSDPKPVSERVDIRFDPIIYDLILLDTNTHIYNIVHIQLCN